MLVEAALQAANIIPNPTAALSLKTLNFFQCALCFISFFLNLHERVEFQTASSCFLCSQYTSAFRLSAEYRSNSYTFLSLLLGNTRQSFMAPRYPLLWISSANDVREMQQETVAMNRRPEKTGKLMQSTNTPGSQHNDSHTMED